MKISDHSRFFPTRTLRLVSLLLSCLVLLAITACGKKGPVRPKIATLPQAPQEVTLHQQGMLFVLGWTLPTKNQDGSPVEDLTGFRVKRLSYDAAQGCPTCQDPQDEVAELDIKYPAPAQRIGDRVYWRDLDILPDRGYRYAIAPITIGGHEGPFTTIHLAAHQPPPAPTALQVKAGDSEVSVQWVAPVLTAEMELVGYNLYRRLAKRPFPIVPVNAEPLKATKLLDRGLENGRAYEYRVSALVRTGEQALESMPGPGVLITPQKVR